MPAAWNVPISGASSTMRAVAVGPGANGSCRLTTSKASSHRARIVRSWAGRSGASGGDRAVGLDRDRVAQRDDGRVGRGAVAGGEDPHVVAGRPQRAGQAQDLALHATGNRQAVGTEQADPHPRER